MFDMSGNQQRAGGALPNSKVDPKTELELLVAKKEKLLEELRNVEKQVYDLETTYLHESSQSGNVLKGFEGFLSSAKGAGSTKRPRKFSVEDRLFSLSSVTSPAAEEMPGRDADARPEQRLKITGTPANGPGKKR